MGKRCGIGVAAALAVLVLVPGAAGTASGVTTIAGGGVADGAQATESNFMFAQDIALNSAGDLFVADQQAQRIREIAPDGTIGTYAGDGIAGLSGDGGPATSAEIHDPTALATDANGDLYIADSGNARVREVSQDGTITTVPGTSAAGLAYPRALEVVGHFLYVADTGNNRVVKFDLTTGAMTLLAGIGSQDCYPTGDGGPAVDAHVCSPSGVAVGPDGELYISENGGHRVRVVGTDGNIDEALPPDATVYADGPRGLAYDSASGKLDVVDQDANQLLSVDPSTETATVIAGSGDMGTSGCGFAGDGGPAADAQFCQPTGIALGSDGSIFVLDTGNWRVRKIDAGGTIDTFAGNGHCCFSGDGGQATNAALWEPTALALGADGRLLIADSFNNRIRQVAQDGTVTTVAGEGSYDTANCLLYHPYAGEGGPGTDATLCSPESVGWGADGTVYFTASGRLLRLSAGGTISTVAGAGTDDPGNGGPAADALVSADLLSFDGSGDIYVTDDAHSSIRKIAPDGTITTLSSIPWPYSFAALAVDGRGNVYAASNDLDQLLKITPAGTVTQLNPDQSSEPCLHPGQTFPLATVELGGTVGLAIDGGDNLYLAQAQYGCVLKVDLGAATATMVAGTGASGFNGDGNGPLVTMLQPGGLAIGHGGDLYVADSGNGRIRVLPGVVAEPNPQIVFTGPSGTTASRDGSLAFSTSSPRSTFQCALDGAPLASCTSPFAFSGLADGDHTFSVEARDFIGNTSEATRQWTIDTTPPLPPQPATFALIVARAGSGSGTVASSPAGIDCGSTCSHAFTSGSQVTLTATPASDSRFAGWSGGGCSGTGTCSVTIAADQTVTAAFLPPIGPGPVRPCKAPKVKGKKLAAAKTAIRHAHCGVGKITKAFSTKVTKGRVIAQKPRPGTRHPAGTKVRLVVSKGRKPA